MLPRLQETQSILRQAGQAARTGLFSAQAIEAEFGSQLEFVVEGALQGRISSLLAVLAAAAVFAQITVLHSAATATPQLARQQPPVVIPTELASTAIPPTMRISVQPVTEGDALVFKIEMVPESRNRVVVQYAFAGDVSALDNSGGGSGVIPPGGSLPVQRQTVDDALVNGDRHVVLSAAAPSLSKPESPRFQARASGLVRDNDTTKPPPPALPQVDINPAPPVTEGRTLYFPLKLSKPAGRAVRVAYRLTDPDGVAEGPNSGTVEIEAGLAQGTIPVQTRDDSLVNGFRAIAVQLTDVSGATLGWRRAARGVVGDDDLARPPAPTFSIAVAEPEVQEGQALTFVVTREGDLSQPGSIDYSLSVSQNGKVDLTSQGSLVFAPNKESNSFTFKPDRPISNDLSVAVNLLQNDGEPAISVGSALGLIRDVADGPPRSGDGSELPDGEEWPPAVIVVIVLVCTAAGGAYWWHRRKIELDPGPGPEPLPDPPPPPDCEIDCTAQPGTPQEPNGIGSLSIPDLTFTIAVTPRGPTTPYALDATFLEERDEPDDPL